MTIKHKTIVINGSMAVAFAFCLHYYPVFAVLVAAAIAFPVANIILFLKARSKAERAR
jgi:hypothetical protein